MNCLPQTAIIIEDDKSNAYLLEMLLQEEGHYRTSTYTTGREVLEHLNEVKQRRPVLFLVDQMLPGMDGISLCEHLHTLEGFTTIPTILLTGSSSTTTLQEAKKRGVMVMQKPYDINELLDVVEQQIAQSSESRP